MMQATQTNATTSTRRPQRAMFDQPTSQLGRTYLALSNADAWLMLHELAAEIRQRYHHMDSEAAISARLRDLRRHHGIDIESRRRGDSPAHEYRLMRKMPAQRQPDMLEIRQ